MITHGSLQPKPMVKLCLDSGWNHYLLATVSSAVVHHRCPAFIVVPTFSFWGKNKIKCLLGAVYSWAQTWVYGWALAWGREKKLSKSVISVRDKMLRFKNRSSRLFSIASNLEEEYIFKCHKINSPHPPTGREEGEGLATEWCLGALQKLFILTPATDNDISPEIHYCFWRYKYLNMQIVLFLSWVSIAKGSESKKAAYNQINFDKHISLSFWL